LLAKPTQLNINLSSDRFAMFNKQRDITGSFNLSNHAMGNAENVLLIGDAAIAELFVKYIQRLMANYAVTNDQAM